MRIQVNNLLAECDKDHDDEESLTLCLKNREPGALLSIYNSYAGTLYAILYKWFGNEVLAGECLEKIFASFKKDIEGYDPLKGRLFTWLLQISRSQATKMLNEFTPDQITRFGLASPLARCVRDQIQLKNTEPTVPEGLNAMDKARACLANLYRLNAAQIAQLIPLPMEVAP